MAAYMNRWYILLFSYLLLTSPPPSSSSVGTCHPQSNRFLLDFQLQCPLSISSSLPVEMDGKILDRVLNSKLANVYTAVFFYASWCPFSSSTRYKFDVLSSMFPQIGHVAIDQSSAMPSMFSRYGIHSLPALLIVNQTAKVRYHGPKELLPMAHFYERTTGLFPVEDLTDDNSGSLITSSQKSQQSWYQLSWNAIVVKEPYLVFGVVFLLLRAFLYFWPGILSRLALAAAAAALYYRHLNLGIFGETRQLLWRVLDVERVCSKLRLCKTAHFQRGARRARVWASSLASVSLGETSSSVRP
ncbi:5-adenylylsulfate reductase-like [Dionaea muscipula]